MNVYDVRIYRYTPTVTRTSGLLADVKPGPAVVRLTGYGGMKLLRTPPPVVRQQPRDADRRTTADWALL